MLLYVPLSSSSYILKTLARYLPGIETASPYEIKLLERRRGEPSLREQRYANHVEIDLKNPPSSLSEEKLTLLDFAVAASLQDQLCSRCRLRLGLPLEDISLFSLAGRDPRRLYQNYAICTAKRLLGIDKEEEIPLAEPRQLNCRGIPEESTGHLHDAKQAVALLDYALSHRGDKIYIATVGTIDPRRQTECFSALARCISTIAPNREVL